MTDAMEMAGVANTVAPGQAPLMALSAGCDLLLYGAWNEGVARQLKRAAEIWERYGDSVLSLSRWETARGSIEALNAAALATERAAQG